MRQKPVFSLFRISAIAAVFILSCAGAALAADWTPAKSAQVDRLIEQARRGEDATHPFLLPAVSVAIGIGDQLVLAKGYGEARPGVPADAHTIYRIGSITKQFTAAAILQLMESPHAVPGTQTELALATPIAAIFGNPSRWTLKDAPEITVKNLLTMTSSLPNLTAFPLRGNDPYQAISASTLLAAVEQFSPQQLPDDFQYNNTGYFLLAQIIERLAGGATHRPDDYRNYLRATFFRPLHMDDTSFFEDKPEARDLALPIWQRRPAFTLPDWLEGSADMTSSVVDLFHWNVAFMKASAVDAKIRDTMLSEAARVGPGDWYGMGLFIRHKDNFDEYAHSGVVPGYSSFNAVFKDGKDDSRVSVTLLSNEDGFADLGDLAAKIFDLAREP